MSGKGGATGGARRIGAPRGVSEGELKPKRKWRPPPPPDRQAQRLEKREPQICPTCHMAMPCECS